MRRRVRVHRAARPRPAGGWSRAARSWQVLLIALGLLLAQGPMLLHFLFVPHATCEHGELVERTGQGADAQPRAAERRQDQQQIERSHQDGEGHDHCDALAMRHRVPEVGANVAAASILWVAPIEGDVERTGTRPVPLLSLAPKGSPPGG